MFTKNKLAIFVCFILISCIIFGISLISPISYTTNQLFRDFLEQKAYSKIPKSSGSDSKQQVKKCDNWTNPFNFEIRVTQIDNSGISVGYYNYNFINDKLNLNSFQVGGIEAKNQHMLLDSDCNFSKYKIEKEIPNNELEKNDSLRSLMQFRFSNANTNIHKVYLRQSEQYSELYKYIDEFKTINPEFNSIYNLKRTFDADERNAFILTCEYNSAKYLLHYIGDGAYGVPLQIYKFERNQKLITNRLGTYFVSYTKMFDHNLAFDCREIEQAYQSNEEDLLAKLKQELRFVINKDDKDLVTEELAKINAADKKAYFDKLLAQYMEFQRNFIINKLTANFKGYTYFYPQDIELLSTHVNMYQELVSSSRIINFGYNNNAHPAKAYNEIQRQKDSQSKQDEETKTLKLEADKYNLQIEQLKNGELTGQDKLDFCKKRNPKLKYFFDTMTGAPDEKAKTDELNNEANLITDLCK